MDTCENKACAGQQMGTDVCSADTMRRSDEVFAQEYVLLGLRGKRQKGFGVVSCVFTYDVGGDSGSARCGRRAVVALGLAWRACRYTHRGYPHTPVRTCLWSAQTGPRAALPAARKCSAHGGERG